MHGESTIETRLGQAPWVLSGLVLVAAAVATISALALPDLLHGPAVMVGSMRGTALVVLVFALPILVLGMAAARRGRLLGFVGWIGSVAFIAYQGWMFLFGLPFNGLFLVYVAMFAFGFWGLVTLLIRVPVGSYAATFAAALPARLLAGWMVASCLAFYALWLKNVVPGLFDSAAPAFLVGTGMVTPTNYVLDMALFLPFTIVVAVALWRRTAWGLVVGGAMLLMLVLESVAIAVDQWAGSAADPGSPVASAAMTPLFLVDRGDRPCRIRALVSRDHPGASGLDCGRHAAGHLKPELDAGARAARAGSHITLGGVHDGRAAARGGGSRVRPPAQGRPGRQAGRGGARFGPGAVCHVRRGDGRRQRVLLRPPDDRPTRRPGRIPLPAVRRTDPVVAQGPAHDRRGSRRLYPQRERGRSYLGQRIGPVMSWGGGCRPP